MESVNDNRNTLEKEKKGVSAYVKYSGVGFQMFFIIFLGIWGGMQLNSYLGFEKPYLTMVIALVSIILSMVFAYRQVTKK